MSRAPLLFLLLLCSCALVSGLSTITTCATDPCADAGGDGDGAIIDAASCPLSCATIPNGWQPITLGPCAASLTPASYVAQPSAQPGACPCSCAVTTSPTCAMSGTKGSAYGPNGCTTAGSFVVGACTAFASAITLSPYQSAEPINPAGGACGVNAQPASGHVSSTPVTICAPPATCPGLVCAGGAASVCIIADGDMPCPTDFPAAQGVGTDVSASCACPAKQCALAASCSPKVHFYSDKTCTTEVASFAATGMCGMIMAPPNTTAGSYKYDTTPTASCTGPALAGTATVGLVNKKTICCKR